MMDSARPHRRILRTTSLKRRSKGLPVNQRVQLERILGVTLSSNAGLSCDSNSGTIAYPAGCVVVLFNPRKNKQCHIFNAAKKTITCLAISRDGKHITTGETGHQPAVRVWDVQEKTQVAEFCGHKFGISCVAFSPNTKEVVSVGTQHDMIINVWNWKTGNKVASNKVSSKVSALAFSEDGKCFVTVGNRHVRFWYLEDRRSKINETVPLMGRSGILGDHKDNFFCDVVAGKGHMCGRFFVITQSGLLCEFSDRRQLDKWVELRTNSAKCITAGQDYIFVGCSEGVVRVFSATSLNYLCSLPKPHCLGVEVTAATNPSYEQMPTLFTAFDYHFSSHLLNSREGAKYPDTMAIAVDDNHKKVTCIYNDRSVYIWDVHDVKRVGKAWSFLYHSGCIWALEMYPPLEDETKAKLPPGCFLTASVDGTIRIWNLDTQLPESTLLKRNIYSNELLKIVYIDPAFTSLCSVDYNPAGATDKTDTTYDDKNGVRSIRVSPDGADLASGDRQGNIRIYDMQYLNEKKHIEAHDSDVMCLEYSYSNSGHFLASSSRDRLIHVFDVEEDYGLVQTLDDHSSSITAVRFTDLNNKLQMISCGADKSILLRNAVTSSDFHFEVEHHLATKISMYDMVVDPRQKFLATACQDRNVRLYNIQTTKEHKCYRGAVGDEGVLLRIHLDPSGSYAATTCTDKNVCILDFHTGELIATVYGHSEVITGVKFANDLKHIITVSADGCIFVWRLPAEVTNQIKGKLHELRKSVKEVPCFGSDESVLPNPDMIDNLETNVTEPLLECNVPVTDCRKLDEETSNANLNFSSDQLPSWAKNKNVSVHFEGLESSQDQIQPKGQWAKRAQSSLEFKSQLDSSLLGDIYSDQREREKTNSSILHESQQKSETLEKWENELYDGDKGEKTGSFSLNRSSTSLSPSFASGKSWSDRFLRRKSSSLELDDMDYLDTESDTAEVMYPPMDSDVDYSASTYEVFEMDDVKQAVTNTDHGNIALQDDVSAEPVSLEDEDVHSNETVVISSSLTPEPDREFQFHTPDKGDFVRENFETVSFSPTPLQTFTKPTVTGEHAVTGTVIDLKKCEPSLSGRRLSLSARFKSHTQLPNFTSVQSSHTPCRPDCSFVKNAVEVGKIEPDAHRNLLAAFSSLDGSEAASCSDSLLTEAENSTQRNPQNLDSLHSQEQRNSPSESTSHIISSSSPMKITEENDLSSHYEPLEELLVDISVTSPDSQNVTRTEPGYSNFNHSLKNKADRRYDEFQQSSFVTDKLHGLSSKNLRGQGRMSRTKTKLYGSTPNIMLGFNSGADNKTVSNLQLLSALSFSTPDIVSADLETVRNSEECCCLQSCTSAVKWCRMCHRTSSYGVNKQQSVSGSSPLLLSTGTVHSIYRFTQSRQVVTECQSRQNYKETLASEFLSDQSERFLTGRSDSKKSSDSASAAVLDAVPATLRDSEDFASADPSLVSVALGSPVLLCDSETTQTRAAQHAVLKKNRQSVNKQPHSEQIYISNTFLAPIHSQSTDLEASPQDLPERDPSNKNSSSLPLSLFPLLHQPQSHCFVGPKSFQNSLPAPAFAGSAYNVSGEYRSTDSIAGFEECKDQNHLSVEDCIALYESQNVKREASVSRSYQCNFPTMPHMTVTQTESYLITGEDSETCHKDISRTEPLLYTTQGTKNKSVASLDDSSIDMYECRDRYKLALQHSASVSLNQCKSILSDFRLQLHMLKDLFTQVDGRSDETAGQIITMLGDVFHEAQVIITDLTTKIPSSVKRNTNSFSLNSLLTMSSAAQSKTFHLSGQNYTTDETSVGPSNTSFLKSDRLGEKAAQLDQDALLAATMKMLQPLVSQLTRDLCEGVCKLVTDRVDENL